MSGATVPSLYGGRGDRRGVREREEGCGMREKIELKGWLAASRNMKITCLGEYMDLGVCVQYQNLLNKFPQDQIFLSYVDQVCFLDGYVYNK